MKVSTFAIRVWRVFSMIVVLGAAAFSYSTFGDDVGVHFDSKGLADVFVHKSIIFYSAVAIILINNVVILNLSKQVSKLPKQFLPIPNQSEWIQVRDVLNEHFKNWFYCIIAAINTVLALTLFALGNVNSTQFKYKLADYEWLIYMAVFMFLVIAIALPIRLMVKPQIDE
jgi:ABC-type glycerol-3-phosphate transport system permease component